MDLYFKYPFLFILQRMLYGLMSFGLILFISQAVWISSSLDSRSIFLIFYQVAWFGEVLVLYYHL